MTMACAVALGCRSSSSRVLVAGEAAAIVPANSSPNPDSEASLHRLAAAHAHYGSGVIHEMDGEPASALKDYYEAARLDPCEQDLVLEVSRRLLIANQAGKALQIVRQAAAQPGASGLVYARLGAIEARLNHKEKAMAADVIAIRKSPAEFSGYQNLFLLYIQDRKARQALDLLDNAAHQPGVDALFLLRLIPLYASLRLQFPDVARPEVVHADAMAALQRVEQFKSQDPSLRLMLADAYNSLGESEKAAPLYLELLKELPDVPMVRDPVRARLTAIYLRSQNPQRAMGQLQAIARDDPTNPQIYYLLGRLAYAANQLGPAADYLRKAILLEPNDEPAYYDLARVQLSLNQARDALQTLRKARKRFSSNFALEFLTGAADGRAKAFKEALRHYTAAEIIAKATDPSRLDQFFYFQVGAAYEQAGEYHEAAEYLQKSLGIAPDFTEAMNYLGYMWAEHGINLEQARRLIAKAVKAEPKNAAYLDSLGWVLYQLKKPQEALPYILKAVQLLDEPDAEVYGHLGDVYFALKEPAKARAAWLKSLSLQPNKELRNKLDALIPK
jgi:tetratricopeptide (TPR) repeat protein